MRKNILEVLEETESKYPNKIAFAEIIKEENYQELVRNSKKIGTGILKESKDKFSVPIVVFMDKTVNCIETMMGILYSGNFYTVMDINSPKERIETILQILQPNFVVIDEKSKSKWEKTEITYKVLELENLKTTEIEEKQLREIRRERIDTDPAYVLFTSGSTGVPKGTVVSHRAVLSYASWVVETFEIDDTTIFGSQTPFYFSMSVLDIFSTLLTGATFYILPKMYFSFPIKLLELMKEKKINTIYWVPSALNIIANLKALEIAKLPDLKKVLFAGEVMPMKPLNYWRKRLPECLFANLYGPTEVTDICSYYVVDRDFEDTETLPIGKACNNCGLFILKEDGTRAKQGEEGELCVRGSFLANGYYNNPEKTKNAFVQNPLNAHYPEWIYKTGDIVKENEKGEILYLSRKDFQIKHMGYRIELGEIETVIHSIEGIIGCCCVYDSKKDNIVLYYQSQKVQVEELAKIASEKLLSYMRPNRIEKLDRMPYNANGKIDRVFLKKKMEEE